MLTFIIVWVLASSLISVLVGKVIAVGNQNRHRAVRKPSYLKEYLVIPSKFSA